VSVCLGMPNWVDYSSTAEEERRVHTVQYMAHVCTLDASWQLAFVQKPLRRIKSPQ
jgi:hypothetical protein